MKKRTSKAILGCVLIGGISSSIANAAIIEGLSFTDTTGTSKLVAPDSTSYINSVGKITTYISSGLDRKLDITVSLNGSTVQSYSSSVINTKNKYSISGQSFYGLKLDLTSFTQEGTYTVQIKTKNLSGETTNTDTYKVIRDVTAPRINGSIYWTSTHGTDYPMWGNINYFARDGMNYSVSVNGLSDTVSGIDKAVYFIKHPNDAKSARYETSASYDSSAGLAAVPAVKAAYIGYASTRANYNIGFDIYDKAGNKSTTSRNSHIDNVCPSTPQLQILNAATGNWENYNSAGHLIYANPVTMRSLRPTSEFNVSGVYGWQDWKSSSYAFSGGLYGLPYTAYVTGGYKADQETFSYPNELIYLQYYTKSARICYTQRFGVNNLNLKPANSSVHLATTVDSVQAIVNNKLQPMDGYAYKIHTPQVLQYVRVNVQPRNYVQVLTDTIVGASCRVPVNGRYCDIPVNFTFNRSTTSHTNLKDFYIIAQSTSGQFRQQVGILRAVFDFDPVTVVSATQDIDSDQLVVRTHNANASDNWWKGYFALSSINAVSLNTQSVAPHTSVSQYDIYNRDDYFNLSGLSDGVHTIQIGVTDYAGNVTTTSTSVDIDHTAPKISISYDGDKLPDTISDIRDILVNMEDPHSSTVIEAHLTGSSSNEDIYLGISNSSNTATFELPRIFPTLLDGEKYDLKITTQDSYGNTSSKSISFGYMPKGIITLDVQSTLPRYMNLKDGNDHPIARFVNKDPLTTESGMVATGTQDAYITNRKTSDFAIEIEVDGTTSTVDPGVTKNFSLDLGETGGTFEIPVYPAVDDVEGTAQVMMDIPQITSLYE